MMVLEEEELRIMKA